MGNDTENCYQIRTMKFYSILSAGLILFSACQSPVEPGKTGEKIGFAGKTSSDYILLKRSRIIDNQGFGEPVEAISFLVPQDWRTEGGISWTRTGCLTNMVQTQFKAVSEDGQFEFLVFPATQFDWSDSPEILDAMQRGGMGSGCEIGEPMNAAAYIQQKLAPLVNANSYEVNTIDQVETTLKEQARAFEQSLQASGIQGYSSVPSASEGKLLFSDGKQGIALCTLTQMISTGPDMLRGGTFSHIQSVVGMRVVLKFPSGKEEMAKRILSTIQSSVRFNMVWGNAIQTMFNNIRKQVQDETWKRIQITQQAQQEISEGIVRSWESKNESSDHLGESWSQYIRGVDSWNDGGNKVDLISGYSNAWKRNDGTYLLINDPSFDPNVSLSENWTQLSK